MQDTTRSLQRHGQDDAEQHYQALRYRMYNDRIIFADAPSDITELTVPRDLGVQEELADFMVHQLNSDEARLLLNPVPIYEDGSCPTIWAAICGYLHDSRSLEEAPCFAFRASQRTSAWELVRLCLLEYRDFVFWYSRLRLCFTFSHDEYLSICQQPSSSRQLPALALPGVKVLWEGIIPVEGS